MKRANVTLAAPLRRCEDCNQLFERPRHFQALRSGPYTYKRPFAAPEPNDWKCPKCNQIRKV